MLAHELRNPLSGVRNATRLLLESSGGRHLALNGHKDLHNDPGPDMWPDTTTLDVRLHSVRGHDPDAPVLGSGELRIRKRDLLRQLGSIETDSPDTLRRFGLFFAGRLWDQYAGVNR